jgi:hypothetical protein
MCVYRWRVDPVEGGSGEVYDLDDSSLSTIGTSATGICRGIEAVRCCLPCSSIT